MYIICGMLAQLCDRYRNLFYLKDSIDLKAAAHVAVDLQCWYTVKCKAWNE